MSSLSLPSGVRALTPEVVAQIKVQYEDKAVRVHDIARTFKIRPASIVMLARTFEWPKRGNTKYEAKPRGTAKRPRTHPKLAHPQIEARTAKYPPETLAAITCLQRAGFVVYQTQRDEFMVGTKRMSAAAMMEKAGRYGAKSVLQRV